jgi:hypothetical protein
MTKYIIKSDGKKEPYDVEKIKSSIIKAGASPEVASKTAGIINKKVKDNMSTDEIHQRAVSHLRALEPGAALRYSLKRAIMNIGPEGFAFEKYIAKILREYGYSAEVGQFIGGYCVEHEVDVVAKKEGKIYLIECKYHNSPGIKSDVKIALYIHSRFLDIEKARGGKYSNDYLEAWLVTNTKCTSDAIKYANCVGLKVMAWHYPRVENLQYFIETKQLYPISILSTINKKQKEILLDSGIILIKELESYKASRIINEARILL